MDGSMDVLHGEQEAELFSEHSYMLKAGDGDYMYVVKWLKHSLSLVPRFPTQWNRKGGGSLHGITVYKEIFAGANFCGNVSVLFRRNFRGFYFCGTKA